MLDLISISDSIITIEQVLDTKQFTTINEKQCPLPIQENIKLDNVFPEMESTTSPPSFDDTITTTCTFNSLKITQLSTTSSHHGTNSITSNEELCASPQATISHINNMFDNNDSDIITMATPFPLTHSVNEAGYLETTNGFDNTTSINNYIPKEKHDIAFDNNNSEVISMATPFPHPVNEAGYLAATNGFDNATNISNYIPKEKYHTPFDNNNSEVISMATPFPLTHSVNEAGYLAANNGFDNTTIGNYIQKEKYDTPFDYNNSEVISMATPFPLTHSVNEAGYLAATNGFDNTTIGNYIPKEKYDTPTNNDQLFEDMLDIDIEYYCEDPQTIYASHGQSTPFQFSDDVSSVRTKQFPIAVEDNSGYIQS